MRLFGRFLYFVESLPAASSLLSFFPKITKLHLRDFAKKCTFCLKLQEGKKGRSSIGVVGSSLGL